MSTKKRGEIELRKAVLVAVRERDRGCCARRVLLHRFPAEIPWHLCGGALDGHEIIPRSEWRDGYLDVDNVLLVCRVHHDWIHNHTTTARTLGLLSHGRGLGE